jgi:amidohydrolase
MRYVSWMTVGLLLMASGAAHAQRAPSPGSTLTAIYEHLHANPELSLQEQATSAFLANEMKRLGFEVTTGVGAEWAKTYARTNAGKLEDGVGGHGVVAVLRNGPGPTLMIRADTDALPVTEKTGLAFASRKTDIAWTGGSANGVMHACGHDVHMTVWIGTAREMVARKAEWSGTLVMIAQPAEEAGLGARMMLADGLFTRFPRPDAAIALHVHAVLPAGAVGFTPGFVMANVDSVDITVRGRGGHGAYPQDAIDPIVIAARIVTTLQTLVSREIDPQDAAVVTVGAFNAGTRQNIIPDEARLLLTVRSFSDATRKKLLDGITRIARAESAAAGLGEDMMPVIRTSTDGTPALYNDPALANRLAGVFRARLGETNVVEIPPNMGGEDFARYGRETPRVPIFLFQLGAAPPAAYEAAQKPGGAPLPALHSALFAPDVGKAIPTGVAAMTAAAMDLLRRG